MKAIYASKALLPDGWRDSVRISLSDGSIDKVESGATVTADDEATKHLDPETLEHLRGLGYIN